jgi:SAM-dependent methyltransferase
MPVATQRAPHTETSAHPLDGARQKRPMRPWYAYAGRILPAREIAGRWVDLGCGRGEFLELAAGRGLTGVGVDYWPSNGAAVARAGWLALAADLNRNLPFRDGSLDGASLLEVIEHIVRAEDLVDELARVIRPGGWLIVTTPNVVHVRYRWRALTGHPPKQEGYHYRFFTKKTLGETFERAGFRRCGYASFGKQALLSRLMRVVKRERALKVRYVVPRALESLFAQHFVWRFERVG